MAPVARPFSFGGDVLAAVNRSEAQTRPTWVDRFGRLRGPAASISGQMRDLRLSPDGRSLAVVRLTAETGGELLLVDLERDTVSRLGQRFVMLVPTTEAAQPVTVILNWRSLLRPQQRALTADALR